MFQPSEEVLSKYADVLVKFALHSGKGVQPSEVVQCVVPDVAKPLLIHLQRAILESGAHMITRLIPTGLSRQFYEYASDDQLAFFPKDYLKARVKLIDHSVGIIADHDMHELEGVDPKKIMQSMESKKEVRQWLFDKEYAGHYTWTGALYGTPAMAKEAGVNLETYWNQIIKACFLDEQDPLAHWHSVSKELERLRQALNALDIKRVHIEADGTDLWISLGEKRQWLAGSGRNIPSFEVFTSPDWRGTNGSITFNQPLYRYGNLIEGIELEFKDGLVTKATAAQNQQLLDQLIARPDANKIGEFSLTDKRLSRITQFMATTLYDENIGGEFGNTHIAVGMAYKDAYDGDPQELTPELMEAFGFNDSGEHCDIISTTNRLVTAELEDGAKKVIYKDGMFTI